MRAELTRFRIRPGKSGRVDEWLRMLNDRMPETLATLEREQMKIEVIFRELVEGQEYLSWFSVQGEGGESIHASPHEVDRLHLEFWRECIDASAGAIDALAQVVLVPEEIARAMGWANPAGSALAWRAESSLKAMPSGGVNPSGGRESGEPGR